MDIRVILNGKKAGLPPVREAIFAARKQGVLEVRPTWEGADVDRLVREAVADGCQRICAGGGDGTVNEVAQAMMKLDAASRPELSILPLGTANDFATSCGVPADLLQALELAQSGTARSIDIVRANDQYFVNLATGGFGAQVTANTPVALKNFLGGGAYTISGLVQALSFVPYAGKVRIPGVEKSGQVIAGAVCNGRQAGGGQVMAPEALLDDGLLDLVALTHFEAKDIPQVIDELVNGTGGDFVHINRAAWAEWQSDDVMPVNLDGEPIAEKKIRFEVVPKAIKVVLPTNCPLLTAE
ncbi:lipid kinase YegS [Persicirhabdus sediminis]|uniref:Lipid kinase YegS n=1 Tax=Persicirhabdus sediminis TaxID=454144 RepID=A0A8J7SLR8_9BACT|nr:lipid kinase YegS [Persicirhabdus sediminis]MBK1792521.1 lipid kinase YegS [Persicirhabdus sediminis]